MCGICGKIYHDFNRSVEEPIINDMMDSIVHRGPDDEGKYLNKNVGLGFRRLSIIDLSLGHQPMTNEDGTVWLVFNGEIYNHQELREILLNKGHIYKTKTDSETIIHLYEEFGVNCVDHLRGMFAFAIWDNNKKQLFIARDRLGEKPLFYHFDNQKFLFGSEVKTILQEKNIERSINFEAMDCYLSLRFIPAPNTMFNEIKKLPAGHFLLVKDGKLEIKQYWKPSYIEKYKGTKQQAIEELDNMMAEVVKMRLMSDVPLGAFLSGGIDSSLIASLISLKSESKPNTFSIGVVDDDYNELPYAKAVAEKYNTTHREFLIKPVILDILPKVIDMMDEPTDPFAISVYNISQVTRQHVTVALGGDGGDELFGGYDRYHGNKFVSYLHNIPEIIRKTSLETLIKIFPEDFSKKSLSQKLRWLNHMSSFDDDRRYFESMSFFRFLDKNKNELYSSDLQSKLNGDHPSKYIGNYFNDDVTNNYLDAMMYTDLMSRLPDYTLQILDRMTMAHSLEGRSPYLDHKLVEFAATLPPEWKVSNGKLKAILREYSKKYLPPVLLTREKQGFGFPLNRWLKNDLKEMINDVFSSSKLISDGYFNRNYVNKIKDEHQKGIVDHQMRIWGLLNMELWYNSFITNK
ncbi:MAG: asparagine synthase (glutamine-hydrolyzing) [Ignavibacteriae bacterium]|nr:asparagine synthase (glutamine-hydrolyzing) [Ignavibacteriota bacterium]